VARDKCRIVPRAADKNCAVPTQAGFQEGLPQGSDRSGQIFFPRKQCRLD